MPDLYKSAYAKMVFLLLVLLGLLQLRLWVSTGSLAQLYDVREQLAQHALENARLQQRNDELAAKVVALQQGSSKTEAIEGLARRDLGLIGRNETFYYLPKQR